MRVARLEDYVDGDNDQDIQATLQALQTRNSFYVQELHTLYEAHRPQSAPGHKDDAAYGQESENLPRYQTHTKINLMPKTTKNERDFTVPQPFQMTVRESGKSTRKSVAWPHPGDARNEDDAECLKQFRAESVPAHVFLPLFNEIIEKKEEKRKAGIQRRTELLLSMQKPFHFIVEDRRKLQARQPVTDQTKEVQTFRKTIPKSVLDPTVSDKLKEAELLRKIQSQIRAKEVLERSSAPISHEARDPSSRSSLKTQQQRLAFLQQKPTFQPHINPAVPDFQELYRNFQKLSLKKLSVKEPTASKPFKLQTSSLRRRRTEPQTDSTEKTLQDSRPLRFSSHLSSLSLNTLPVYITDATKRREAAIRKSLEDRDHEETEREAWVRKSRQKALRIQKSLSRRAKELDPHRPLVETNQEKLREIRQTERSRSQEYKEELKQMKAQVKRKPFLFERVPRGVARQEMESTLADNTQWDRLTEGSAEAEEMHSSKSL